MQDYSIERNDLLVLSIGTFDDYAVRHSPLNDVRQSQSHHLLVVLLLGVLDLLVHLDGDQAAAIGK